MTQVIGPENYFAGLKQWGDSKKKRGFADQMLKFSGGVASGVDISIYRFIDKLARQEDNLGYNYDPI